MAKNITRIDHDKGEGETLRERERAVYIFKDLQICLICKKISFIS